jgi:hypothetical protein
MEPKVRVVADKVSCGVPVVPPPEELLDPQPVVAAAIAASRARDTAEGSRCLSGSWDEMVVTTENLG